jgi:hypothetical protein
MQRKTASSAATMKSHARASSNAPPNAAPRTADLKSLDGAKRLIAFANEGPERIGIFPQEIENIASLAEIASLGPYKQCPDIALAGFVNGSLQGIREARVDKVLWRVGQHDVTNSVRPFELDDLHFKLSSMRRGLQPPRRCATIAQPDCGEFIVFACQR